MITSSGPRARGRSVRLATLSLVGVGTLVGASAAPSLASGTAASASLPGITDHETLQVQADANGHVTAARLFNQLVVTGDGHFVIAEPTATDGLRNLNGFTTPKVVAGKAVWSIDVHGKAQRRTLANLPHSKLPLSLVPSYTLNGQPIAAKDIIDKSGVLTASYQIRNLTATPETITYKDAHGHLTAATAEIVTPMAAQLVTTLPSSFQHIDAKLGSLAADGHGGTITAWQMLLYPPLGNPQATFGYTARISHASLPAVTLQAVPVGPVGTEPTKYGEDQIKVGADSARQVTQGGVQLDAGLMKLADGAGQLMSGLDQLYAGASQLTDGLDQASSGASQLSGGVGKASSGGRQLANGMELLDAGTRALHSAVKASVPKTKELAKGAKAYTDGVHQAHAGSQQLSSGASALSDAASLLASELTQLAGSGVGGQVGALLNQLAAGASQLAGGVSQLASSSQTLAAGLGQLDSQGATLAAGAQEAATGFVQLAQNVATLAEGEHGARHGADQLAHGLAQLFAGSKQLASGVGQAATGSHQLTQGLGKADAGPHQIVSGVDKLRNRGSKKLISSGAKTGNQFGKQYGVLQALDAKASHGGLLYPAPAGAKGAAAYSFTLASASHTSANNVRRGALALSIVVFACLAAWALRRTLAAGGQR